MYSLKDAAILLGVHVNTIRRWIKEGKIKAVKMGKNWKIPSEEMNRVSKEGVKL